MSIQKNLTNESFRQIQMLLDEMGMDIKILGVNNDEVRKVNLLELRNCDTYERFNVTNEIISNPWYFFREICRCHCHGSRDVISNNKFELTLDNFMNMHLSINDESFVQTVDKRASHIVTTEAMVILHRLLSKGGSIVKIIQYPCKMAIGRYVIERVKALNTALRIFGISPLFDADIDRRIKFSNGHNMRPEDDFRGIRNEYCRIYGLESSPNIKDGLSGITFTSCVPVMSTTCAVIMLTQNEISRERTLYTVNKAVRTFTRSVTPYLLDVFSIIGEGRFLRVDTSDFK